MPPMPHDLPQLRQNIMDAVAVVDLEMLRNVCGRNFITGLMSAMSPRVNILSTCKVGEKLGVSHPLLICSPHPIVTIMATVPRV